MNAPQGPAAPASGFAEDTPTFNELAADPQIAALLDFEPVPRQLHKANGWTPAMQRMFIAWLAYYGSPGNAAGELGKARSGIDKVYKSADAGSFRAAWDGAVALFERRLTERLAAEPRGAGALKAPFANPRRVARSASAGPLPGQVLNELGEWEDEASLERRTDDARDSIASKLLNARRLYLAEISKSAGMRAAFEILTQFPIDWDKAGRLEPQPDEPWRVPNMRQPDMLLTAENGWIGGIGYGPDKMASLRKALDKHLAEKGLPPVDWDEE